MKAAGIDGRARRLIRTSLLVLAVVLATTFLVELLVRISGYADRYVYDPIYGPSGRPEEIPYVHLPGLRDALAQGATRFSTDSLGLRSMEPGALPGPKKPGEYRIAVVGDSVTFGQGVSTADTFCHVLEARLAALRPRLTVRVFNFGVCGYSVKEMEATFRHRVPEVAPDLAILAIIFSDFELHRCGRLDRWGYLHNWKVASYQEPNAIRYLLLRQLHLTFLVRDVALRLGVAAPKMGSRSAAAGESEVPPAGTVPASYPFVTAIADTARRNRWAFLVVTLPSLQYGGPEFDGLRARFGRDRIDFVDFSRLVTAFPPSEYRVSRYDGHPGRVVHHRIGIELAERVERTFLSPAAEAPSGAAYSNAPSEGE